MARRIQLFYFALLITIGNLNFNRGYTILEDAEEKPKCQYIAWKKETICEKEGAVVPTTNNDGHMKQAKSNHHLNNKNLVDNIPLKSKSKFSVPLSNQCHGIYKSYTSSIYHDSNDEILEASNENALKWWNCTYPYARHDSPPTPGGSTLVFIHVPKVGGCVYILNLIQLLSLSLSFQFLVYILSIN